MVAAVRNLDGDVTGLHRTWLRADGAGKADLSQARTMLGICRGGAMRLAVVGADRFPPAIFAMASI